MVLGRTMKETVSFQTNTYLPIKTRKVYKFSVGLLNFFFVMVIASYNRNTSQNLLATYDQWVKSVLISFSSEKETGLIYIYDGRGTSTALHTLNLHTKPVTFIKVFSSSAFSSSAGNKFLPNRMCPCGHLFCQDTCIIYRLNASNLCSHLAHGTLFGTHYEDSKKGNLYVKF